jgi:hypothetical protein
LDFNVNNGDNRDGSVYLTAAAIVDFFSENKNRCIVSHFLKSDSNDIFFKKTLALSKKVDPTLKIVKDHKHVVNNFFLFLVLSVFFLFSGPEVHWY